MQQVNRVARQSVKGIAHAQVLVRPKQVASTL